MIKRIGIGIGLLFLVFVVIMLAITVGPRLRYAIKGYHFFSIPTGSMKPGLLPGDMIYMKPFSHPEDLERGDIIAHRHPLNDDVYFRRVIAFGGEIVSLQNSIVSIDGVEIEQTAKGDFVEIYEEQGRLGVWPTCSNQPTIGADCIKELLVETLPSGRQYSILNIRDGNGDNRGDFVVPEDHLFTMGDNRDNALDSRYSRDTGGPGFIPVENVFAVGAILHMSNSKTRDSLDDFLKEVQ